MVNKKPRIVIIGAGMAGLTAANKLHTNPTLRDLFDVSIVEGSSRIGGRINTSEFCGDRIELGATWIHGIENSPVYKIAQETNSLTSEKPYECMDGILEHPITVAEGGHVLNHQSLVEPIDKLFKNLMDFIQGKPPVLDDDDDEISREIVGRLSRISGGNVVESVGSVLRQGLELYWEFVKEQSVDNTNNNVGNWSRKSLEDRVFAMLESVQRTYTSAHDLYDLDYNAEKDYVMFPGEEVTIAKGYSSVVESLASVLPKDMIQFNKRVQKIVWRDNVTLGESKFCYAEQENGYNDDDDDDRPVKLHFDDGSIISVDHVVVTVSLGVLKRGIGKDHQALFDPPLPLSKAQAISKLGYGVVNKVFLQSCLSSHDQEFPFLQMVFHDADSELKNPEIPDWIRKTSFITPIYSSSRVLLSWFTGKEALELESMSKEEIVKGLTSTISNLLPIEPKHEKVDDNSQSSCNGSVVADHRFERVLRTQWGTNPLFLGSYSYVAVGSSIDDMDVLAEPLPEMKKNKNPNLDFNSDSIPSLQILFAGEATHKTHYSTTHGAYFSGLREANRLIKHYMNYDNGV